MTQQTFNPSEHLMQLQGKDYLEVKWRLVWFRDKFPNGSIETEMLQLDLDRETEEEVMVWNPETRRKEKVIKRASGFVVFRAVVKDGLGGIGTGTKSEKAASFPDYIEKCESGSIGRALAALGFGTQFTGDELAEHHRIVDSPVERAPDAQNGNGHQPATAEKTTSASTQPQSQGKTDPAQMHQIQALRARCKAIGKDFSVLAKMIRKAAVPDDALTAEDCAKADVLIAGWEGFYAKEQEAKVTSGK
jgi:hypothetical protein